MWFEVRVVDVGVRMGVGCLCARLTLEIGLIRFSC